MCTPCDDRQPISPQVLAGLLRVLEAICRSKFETRLFHAVALVPFFGVLRISELVAQSKSASQDRALLYQYVQFTESGVTIRVKRSKTDQLGKGSQIVIGFCEVTNLCPVRALWEFISLWGEALSFLFCHANGTPLTKDQFWMVSSKALDNVGLQGARFGTHSFCIGAVSTAAMGFSPAAIQRVGHWRSRAFRPYIRPLNKF